jgi:hypothetical protein
MLHNDESYFFTKIALNLCLRNYTSQMQKYALFCKCLQKNRVENQCFKSIFNPKSGLGEYAILKLPIETMVVITSLKTSNVVMERIITELSKLILMMLVCKVKNSKYI